MVGGEGCRWSILHRCILAAGELGGAGGVESGVVGLASSQKLGKYELGSVMERLGSSIADKSKVWKLFTSYSMAWW